MNSALIALILVPILEIYLFIKIGSQIGAFMTISLIISTAVIGVFYARYEGLNTLKSAFVQLIKNEIPVYEIISGAAITFAALLLIIPGFATDIIGFLLIFPLSRKFILKILSSKFQMKKKTNEKFIDGEYEEIEKDDDKKL